MTKIDNPLYKRFIPITRVINAALIDTYGDVTKSKEVYMHWAARGLKALQKQVIKTGKRRVMIDVNKSFMSATLPSDFLEENLQFVGFIDERGYKIALGNDTRLTNDKSIETIECEDTCPKCKQDKGICNDLTVTETTEVEVITTTTAGVAGVSAVGVVTITQVGSDGSIISFYSGNTLIGSYEKQPSDTNVTILASNIALALSSSLYVFTAILGVITITAAISLGATVNGTLSINIVIPRIFDTTFDNTFN